MQSSCNYGKTSRRSDDASVSVYDLLAAFLDQCSHTVPYRDIETLHVNFFSAVTWAIRPCNKGETVVLRNVLQDMTVRNGRGMDKEPLLEPNEQDELEGQLRKELQQDLPSKSHHRYLWGLFCIALVGYIPLFALCASLYSRNLKCSHSSSDTFPC